MQTGIYKIENLITGHFYIGSASNFSKRWGSHIANLRKNTHPNTHLQRAWNKYGEKNFEFSVLKYCLKSELKENEQSLLINNVGSKLCYNISKDAYCPGRGLKQNNKTKQKRSNSLRGRTLSNEHKIKIGNSNRGKCRSEAIKENLKEKNRGKQLSDATKKKIQSSLIKKMIDRGGWPQVIDFNGNIHTITSLKEFCMQHSLTYSVMWKVLSGQIRHHKGWHLPNTSLILTKNEYKSKLAKPAGFSKIKSPAGQIIEITTLRGFCKQYNLKRDSVKAVLSGKFYHTKGWTLA